MDISDLKLGDVQKLLTLLSPNGNERQSPYLNKKVIVRTYSAGVHYGTLCWHSGTEAVLQDARRIFRWKGAFTLNEVANHGVSEGSKLSEPLAEILLTEAIELIPLSHQTIKVLDAFPVFKP